MSRALVVMVLAIALVTDAQAQTEPAALTDAIVVEREGAVEVWIRLTHPARFHADVLEQPPRLVLDFDDTVYRWTGTAVPSTREPVRELRGSQFKKGVARLVVELRRPASHTIEQDREGLRIIFASVALAEPAPRAAAPRRGASEPLVYGIVMLDAEAHAYIFDPALQQVRRYRVGDTVGGAVIETIGERHVVLRTAAGRRELGVETVRPATRPR